MTSVTGALSRIWTENRGGVGHVGERVRTNGVQSNSIYDALLARFRELLGESVRTDEHGRNVVWEGDPYFIAVDNPDNVGYLSLWWHGPKRAEKIGEMFLVPGRTSATKDWTVVRNVEIKPKFRGHGLGKQLYQTAIAWLPQGCKGLASEGADRSRPAERVWKRLGAREFQGDYFLDRDDELTESAGS